MKRLLSLMVAVLVAVTSFASNSVSDRMTPNSIGAQLSVAAPAASVVNFNVDAASKVKLINEDYAEIELENGDNELDPGEYTISSATSGYTLASVTMNGTAVVAKNGKYVINTEGGDNVVIKANYANKKSSVEFSLPNGAGVDPVKSIVHSGASSAQYTALPTAKFDATNGYAMTFTLDEETYQVESVKVNGSVITGKNSVYTVTVTENLNVQIYVKSASTINYYLVGTLAENGWDHTKASPMENDEIIRNVAAGTYEFKVLPTLGSWDGALGSADVNPAISSEGYEDNGGNVKITLSETGDVKVVVKDGKIGVVGKFTKAVVSSYTIAGVVELTGASWDPAASANDMTEKDGVWTLVKNDVTLAAGGYDYKMVGNHAWGVADNPASGNNKLNITEDGIYKVTFTYNPKDNTLSAAAEKVAEIPAPAEPVLADGDYLIANVEGGYLGGGNDWGTHATNINRPQWFTITISNGKYLLDSHQSNGGNNHYLSTALYVDSEATGWEIQAVDEEKTIFTISVSGQYLAAKDGLNKVLSLVGESEVGSSAHWKFISLEDIKKTMEDASEYNPAEVTALIKDPELKRNGNTSGYWTITGFDGESKVDNFAQGQGGNAASCAESFHSANGFKVVQTITLPKPGVYVLAAQAFYRNDGEDNLIPYIFAGDQKSNFPERTGTENNMVEAYNSFLAETYQTEAIFIETTEVDQKVQIGAAGESTAKWNIFGEFALVYFGPDPVDFDETPYEGTVESLSEIVLSSDETITVSDDAKVTLLGMQSTIAEFSAEALKAGLAEDSKSIKITLATPVTEAGKYILNIPAGAFTIGGKANTAQMIEWTIEEAPAPAAEIALTSTTFDSNGGKLVFDYSIAFAIGEDGSSPESAKVNVSGANGNVATQATLTFDIEDWKTLVATFDNELQAGSYTMTIPAGLIVDVEPTGASYPGGNIEFTVEAPAPAIALAEGYTAITSADELEGWEVVLMNVENGEYVYGSNNQNIGTSADFAVASSNGNSAPSFRIVKDALGFKFVALTPAGENYNIWGACPSYINSQANDGGVSFILNDKDTGKGYVGGQDLDNGAIWTCEYNTEKAAFAIKNVGSGLYLNGNLVTSTPAYYVIARKSEATNGIATISATFAKDGKYIENGKLVIVKNGVKYNVAGLR